MIVTILYRLEMEDGRGENTIESPSSVSFADTFPPGGRLVSFSFEDVEPGSWYEEAVNWAAANGIITGVTDTTLVPKGKSTRAQAATMLMRYCKSN
ncbi:MAG: S-layer homology domain-containing protein [Firmicutes bacterium]|nr:S-layer homology domain-containing protein [Bacillota bacterium]